MRRIAKFKLWNAAPNEILEAPAAAAMMKSGRRL
jgi:hypothetical protein